MMSVYMGSQSFEGFAKVELKTGLNMEKNCKNVYREIYIVGIYVAAMF